MSPEPRTDSMDLSAPFLSYSSDSEFYSLSSPDALSPYPSLPPSPQTWGPEVDTRPTPSGEPPTSVSPSSGEESIPSYRGKRRGRKAKNPSKQRQSASEKEKLRMRDLTKALHHLRTFLPPSVAPAGQTLTKIETLRLAIRYISHLSEQLGLSEQPLACRREPKASESPTAEPAGFSPHVARPGLWGHSEQGQGHSTARHVWPSQTSGAQHNRFTTTLEESLRDELLNSSLDSLLQSPPCTEMAQSLLQSPPCTEMAQSLLQSPPCTEMAQSLLQSPPCTEMAQSLLQSPPFTEMAQSLLQSPPCTEMAQSLLQSPPCTEMAQSLLQSPPCTEMAQSLLQSPPCTEMTQSYQMYSRDLSSQIVPQEFWI